MNQGPFCCIETGHGEVAPILAESARSREAIIGHCSRRRVISAPLKSVLLSFILIRRPPQREYDEILMLCQSQPGGQSD